MKTGIARALALTMFGLALPVSLMMGDDSSRMLGTVALAKPLVEAVPEVHEGWKGKKFKLTETELDMIQPDDYVNRLYTGPNGEQVLLYIVYHGNKERGAKQYYHNASICYPAQGFTIEDTVFGEIVLNDIAKQVPTCRYTFQRAGDRKLVMTFFKVDDELLDQSPRNQQAWQIKDRLNELFSLDDSPGTFTQVQVIVTVRDGDDFKAGELQKRFLQDFGRTIFEAID